MITAAEALEHLKAGNQRFAAGTSRYGSGIGADRRDELTSGQNPLAVVVGCSDSRVPLEIVFDQGLGDLFVIRVAGNIVNPSQIESVEFAVAKLDVPLVVVLGHEDCGAVKAAVAELQQEVLPSPLQLPTLMNALRPAVEPMFALDPPLEPAELLHRAVRANTLNSVGRLRSESTLLADLIAKNELLVMGAEYSLATGRVEFLGHQRAT